MKWFIPFLAIFAFTFQQSSIFEFENTTAYCSIDSFEEYRFKETTLLEPPQNNDYVILDLVKYEKTESVSIIQKLEQSDTELYEFDIELNDEFIGMVYVEYFKDGSFYLYIHMFKGYGFNHYDLYAQDTNELLIVEKFPSDFAREDILELSGREGDLKIFLIMNVKNVSV